MGKNLILKSCFLCLCLILSFSFCKVLNYKVNYVDNLLAFGEVLESSKTPSNDNLKTYEIYDKDGALIDTKQGAYVGDYFILSNLKAYEIVSVNEENGKMVAEEIGEFDSPKVKFSNNVNLISNKNAEKTIGLYMTHNDESYVEGDGTESVYGEGGIHDITQNLAECFASEGITAIVDETLHLPHDTKAYNRSKSTAQELLNDNIDYVFDIHRDGAPYKAFVSSYNGEELCQIRMVVGQNNKNKEQNLDLATNLLAVGSKMYPNLFKDIYFGKGSYNQDLSQNSLLFEMGSHEVPKNLVLKSVPLLADVINKTLFESEITNSGELVVYKGESNNGVSLLNKTNKK